MRPETRWLRGLETARLDLWKQHTFTIKDAALLCLFLTGAMFLAALPLRILRLDFIILNDAVFLGIVAIMLRQSGRPERREILAWRKVPAPLFFSLLAMFFGLEILRRELGNVLNVILPVPEGFFRNPLLDSVFTAFTSYAAFPAVTDDKA
jgi:hypothetical protein